MKRSTTAYEDAQLTKRRAKQDCLEGISRRRPFDYAEIMERPVVWPGDEA